MDKIDRFSWHAFIAFSALLLACIFLAIYTRELYIAAIPAGVLFALLVVADFRQVFWLLMAMIPLSIEFSFSGTLATDLPTEPLMIVLMVVFGFYLLTHPKEMPLTFLKHPIILLLLLHFLWLAITVIYAKIFLISLKFLLAKTWYLMVFVFLAQSMLLKLRHVKHMIWLVLIPLLFTIVQSLIRHASVGFGFETINETLVPFYRNHVSYAALMTLFFPFVWFARQWYPSGSFRRLFLTAGLIIILTGVFFAYTRGAWLALFVAIVSYALIRMNQLKWMIGPAIVGIVLFLGFLIRDNEYLEYSTDYKKTIQHENLTDHLKATMQRLDVSSAERVYRWIAGFRMSVEELGTGFGPGNFYNHYKSYTVNNFTTWVSDNPERSGIHNYFLMTLVEQGVLGLILFTIFCIYILIKGEMVYRQTKDKFAKQLIMAAILSTLIIYVQIMLSDLIEVDKVGTFFYINLALIVNQDLKNQGKLSVG